MLFTISLILNLMAVTLCVLIYSYITPVFFVWILGRRSPEYAFPRGAWAQVVYRGLSLPRLLHQIQFSSAGHPG